MAIRKVTPIGTNWVVTTVAGSLGTFGSTDGTNNAARFLYPQGIALDGAGNLYVSDGGDTTVRRLARTGTNWVVTTLGGSPRPADGVGQAGAADGIGSAARISNTWGLAVDAAGDVFVADAGGNPNNRTNPPLLLYPPPPPPTPS